MIFSFAANLNSTCTIWLSSSDRESAGVERVERRHFVDDEPMNIELELHQQLVAGRADE